MRSLLDLEFIIWDLQLPVHAGPFLLQKQVPFCVLLISDGMAEVHNCTREEPCQMRSSGLSSVGPCFYVASFLLAWHGSRLSMKPFQMKKHVEGMKEAHFNFD